MVKTDLLSIEPHDQELRDLFPVVEDDEGETDFVVDFPYAMHMSLEEKLNKAIFMEHFGITFNTSTRTEKKGFYVRALNKAESDLHTDGKCAGEIRVWIPLTNWKHMFLVSNETNLPVIKNTSPRHVLHAGFIKDEELHIADNQLNAVVFDVHEDEH